MTTTEDHAHLPAVNAANCDECPVLENREHDIACLEAEIIALKDERGELQDRILSLEHELRRARD